MFHCRSDLYLAVAKAISVDSFTPQMGLKAVGNWQRPQITDEGA